MTKCVFLPLVSHEGRQGVFQLVPESDVPTLTERADGKKLILVETISQYRMRYAVLADEEGHACDEVVMERAPELSQEWLGESIISSREIDNAEYLRIFDADNDYLRSWDVDQKMKMIHKIDYT